MTITTCIIKYEIRPPPPPKKEMVYVKVYV